MSTSASGYGRARSRVTYGRSGYGAVVQVTAQVRATRVAIDFFSSSSSCSVSIVVLDVQLVVNTNNFIVFV